MFLFAIVQETSYVSEAASKMAREIEQRFQKLSVSAGVIFVGVTAKPMPGGKTTGFEIRLGISRHLTEDVGWALIQQVLKNEIASKTVTITGSVYTGLPGAFRDESIARPHSVAGTPNDPV